jgi:hypothetical protein
MGYNLAEIRDCLQRSFNVVLQQDIKAPTPLRQVIPSKVAPVRDFSGRRDPDAPANKR